MHQDRISLGSSSAERCGDDRDDSNSQGQVLALLLAEHPALFTETELRLVIVGAEADFEAEDAYERAVAELVQAGLVYRHGTFLIPSRAVRVVDDLDMS